MFLHNLKYNIKILFKNKVLIFWTFAFPIILGIFFYMAFSNIEKDEMLQVFDIAIVDDEEYQKQEIYKKTFEELSNDNNKDKLFNIKYTTKEDAENLLENGDIEGYIFFKNNQENITIKENGINQTILKYISSEIEQNTKIINDLTAKELANGNSNDITQIVNQIVSKINNEKVNLVNISNSNLSYMQIEYYTLIAMACMYGGMLGLTAINNSLANMSDKGKRISVSPNKKGTIILSSLLASYFVSLVGLTLLMLFLVFIIKADFGSNFPLVILLSMIGSLAGISLGVMIASTLKVSEGAKTGIIIAVSMFLSVLSGMTGVELKYVIDKNIPIINLINPNNLITDGFYSLYYYGTYTRYLRDLSFLGIFIFICLIISLIGLRRQQYDSI